MEQTTLNELEQYARKCFIAYNPLLLHKLICNRLIDINNMYDRTVSHYVIDEIGSLYNDCVSVENLAIQIVECKQALSHKVKRYKALKRDIDDYLSRFDDQHRQEAINYLTLCGQAPMTKAVIRLLTYLYERKEIEIEKRKAEQNRAFIAWQEKQV